MARPSNFTPIMQERILTLLCEYPSLRAALESADDLPTERTVFRWLAQSEEFRQAYALARTVGDEADVEEMRRIAFDQSIASDQKRVMIDTLKWQLGRRLPKKWGERVQLADADGNNLPVPPQFIVNPVSPIKERGGE